MNSTYTCGSCKFWICKEIGYDKGRCRLMNEPVKISDNYCDKFKPMHKHVPAPTIIINTCGLCKFWTRTNIGYDKGKCCLNTTTESFHKLACTEFKSKKQESDPEGLQAKDPGAKLDAGKIRADLLADFGPGLLKVAQICDYGAKKYSEKGWMEVADARKRYNAAFWRHLLAGEGVDPESNLPHRWHCMWNLLAMLSLEEDNV